MTPADLHGFVPAIVTPFDESGAIMEDGFIEVLEFLIGRGASAVCIAGDNGESWALSAAERGRLVRLAADHSKGRIKVILGISAPTFPAALAYVEAGRDNGADALLSMPQTYVLKASEAETATILCCEKSLVGNPKYPSEMGLAARTIGSGANSNDSVAPIQTVPVSAGRFNPKSGRGLMRCRYPQ